MHHACVNAETLADPPDLVGKGDLKLVRKTLTEHLTTSARMVPMRGWFLGLDYNLADTAWAVLFYRLPGLDIKLSPEAAVIVRYAERLFARPAFQKTIK